MATFTLIIIFITSTIMIGLALFGVLALLPKIMQVVIEIICLIFVFAFVIIGIPACGAMLTML